MRVIKFRVWNGKKFLSGRDLDDICLSLDGEPLIREGQELNLLEDEYKVQQFTGLRDKNDNDIFEGDILLFCSFEKYYLVEWSLDKFELRHYTGEISQYGRVFKKLELGLNHHGVCIGNIFENSELLK